MIDLTAIERHISEHLQLADQSMNKNLIAVLDKIQLLINHYKIGSNPTFLIEILLLIESIKIHELSRSFSFFSISNSEYMRTRLASRYFSILTKSEEPDAILDTHGLSNISLSAKDERPIGFIYQTIRRDPLIASIMWHHSMQKNARNEITSPEILEWQKDMQLISSPLQAMRDFKRDIRIMDNDPKTFPSDADTEVYALVSKMTSESTYPDDQKGKINAWLLANGGQEMNVFISHMINNQTLFRVPVEMTDDNNDTDLTTRSDSVNNSWRIDYNGNIVYDQNFHIRSINSGSRCILAVSSSGRVKVIHNNDESLSEYEDTLTNKENPIRYIASIYCRIQLVIRDGLVTPIVTSLDILSQTDTLMTTSTARNKAENTHALSRPQSARF